MTERPEAKRREEALGWLMGRLAWEKGLRFDTSTTDALTTDALTTAALPADEVTADDVTATAQVPVQRKTRKAAA